ESHSCGREGALELLCWGSRDRGQLGDGPCNLTGMGSGAGCFPSSEFPISIVSGGKLGSGSVHIDQLIVGGTFSCIVNVNAGSGSFFSRKVRCWGTQDSGAKGIFFADSASTAVDLTPGLSASANITEVNAGSAHLCVRTDDIWWVERMGINDHAPLGGGKRPESSLGAEGVHDRRRRSGEPRGRRLPHLGTEPRREPQLRIRPRRHPLLGLECERPARLRRCRGRRLSHSCAAPRSGGV